jgi:hypothetical protein
MTESRIKAVISTSVRGEISSNKQISLRQPTDRDDKKWKSVIGSAVEGCFNKTILKND